MIHLKGTLIIRVKSGRKGKFSVGELITEIGTFKVKETLLDQYEEGKYEGTFVVSQIYSSSYSWVGGVVAEIRAKLEQIYLASSDDQVPEASTGIDPDPIDEQPPLPPAEKLVDALPQGPELPQSSAPTEPSDSDDRDLALFGEIASDVAKRLPVRLDPTIDREMFRAQRDRLKALGYSFNATHQTWQVLAE